MFTAQPIKRWLDRSNFAICVAHKYKYQVHASIYWHLCVNIHKYIQGLFVLQVKLILLGFSVVYLISLNLRSTTLHMYRNYNKSIIIKYLLNGLCRFKMLTLP